MSETEIEKFSFKDFQQWMNENQTLKNNRVSFLQRLIYKISHEPYQFFGLLFLLIFILFAIEQLLPRHLISTKFYESNFLIDGNEIFLSLMSIQATLAALVFPIVISFVAIILQKKPGSRELIRIYILYSGAIISGISSLFLLVFMGSGLMISEIFNPERVSLWNSISISWFILNLFFTMIFLNKTVEFLNPNSQIKTVSNYLYNYCFVKWILKFFVSNSKCECDRQILDAYLKKYKNIISGFDLIDDLKDEICEAINEGKLTEFKKSYNKFIEITKNLLLEARCQIGTEEINLAEKIYIDEGYIFSQELYKTLLRKSYTFINLSCSQINNKPEFFKILCGFSVSFIDDHNLSFEVKKEALDFHKSLLNALGDWFINNSYKLDINKTPEFQNFQQKKNYNSCYINFISSWGLIQDILKFQIDQFVTQQKNQEPFDPLDKWRKNKICLSLIYAHISILGISLYHAVNRDDIDAYGWLADELRGWMKNYDLNYLSSVKNNLYYLNNIKFIAYPPVNDSWNDVKEMFNFKEHYNEADFMSQVVYFSITTFCEDIQVLFTEKIIKDSLGNKINSRTKFLGKFIQGTLFKSDEESYSKVWEIIRNRYITTKIRHYFTLASNHSYLCLLNIFSRDLSVLLKKERISMRAFTIDENDFTDYMKASLIIWCFSDYSKTLTLHTIISKNLLPESISNSVLIFNLRRALKIIQENDANMANIAESLKNSINFSMNYLEKIEQKKIILEECLKSLEATP